MVHLTSELRKGVQRLSALSKLSEEEFTADPDKVGSAKYHLIVAIEICIDICTHLLSLSPPFDIGPLGVRAQGRARGGPKVMSCQVRGD